MAGGSPGALGGAGKDADATFGTGKAGRAVDPCPPGIPRLTLHLDADRDGVVDSDPATGVWKYGRGNRGAVILCNDDDDDLKHKLDVDNNVIDTAADVPDIAPLVVRRSPAGQTFPPGFRAFLRVSNKARIRVFEQRSGSASEILGPTSGKDTYEITDLRPQEITFGMEAVGYAGAAFDGHVDISLEVRTPAGGTCGWSQARVRVAPWMMQNHLDATETVYVMNGGAWNQRFRNDIKAAVTGAGVPAPQEANGTVYGNDIWMQDVMELGYQSFPRLGVASGPDWNMPVVLRTAADRGNRNAGGGTGDDFPKRELLGRDFGYHETQAPTEDGESLDSFGNLECSPPVEVAGRKYPFGRIVYGLDPKRPIRASVSQFLVAQRAQAPFTIDTSFLDVGHVDEVMSFCPMASAADVPRFRVLTASPAVALQILRDLQSAGNGPAPMFQRIDVPPGGTFDSATYSLNTPDKILNQAPATFVAVQNLVQAKMDAVEKQLATNLGLKAEHFIRLPVLFQAINRSPRGKPEPTRYVAYTPGVVNMLVVTKTDQTAVLCIPKPFGPIVGGVCQFEAKINALLAPLLAAAGRLGNQIRYIDDFVNYHQGEGEIHCGSNSKRKPRTDLWWWEVDPP